MVPRTAWWTVIAVGVLTLAGCGGASTEKHAQQAFSRFFAAAARGDGAGACHELSARLLARVGGAGKCAQGIRAAARADRARLVMQTRSVATRVRVAGDRARVTLQEPIGKINLTSTGVAVRAGGAWKIDQFPVESARDAHSVVRVPSAAMLPTIRPGDVIAVVRRPLRVGAIVVFHPPEGATSDSVPQCGDHAKTADEACDRPDPHEVTGVKFVKRIVAGPGDRLAMRDGHVIRNGTPVREPYLTPCDGAVDCSLKKPITIRAGEWFVLGDNRGQSDDSRFWGPVPGSWIVGTMSGVVGRIP